MIVAMSTYNRASTTKLCLNQISRTKSKDTKIQCWDARSTEYDSSDLYEWGADEVFVSAGKCNDGQNRSLQFSHFLNHETDDLLYCVDNDGYHDYRWNSRLLDLWNTHRSIVCLFNAYDHSLVTKSPYYKLPHGNNIAETDDVVFRYTCGGISFLLSRKLIQRNFKGWMSFGYDWKVPRWDRHVCTSKESYVAHINYDGMHTPKSGGAVDIGLNPTDYLKRWLKKYQKHDTVNT